MESVFAFRVVRRGYDRAQVDEQLARLVAERDTAVRRAAEAEAHAGQPEQGTPEAEAPVIGFALVRRGYDRDQVDVAIARLVDERDRAAARLRARF